MSATPDTSQPQNIVVGGKELKAQLAKATRQEKIKAFTLVLPLLAFILVMFILPLADMMFRSVDNGPVAELMPRTEKVLADWDSGRPLTEEMFTAIAQDIRTAKATRSLGKISTRLNFEQSGIRSLLSKTGRKLARIEQGPWKDHMLKIDKRWGQDETWAAFKHVMPPLTAIFYLNAADLTYDENGHITAQDEQRAIYMDNLTKTLLISFGVTVACFVLGFPIAYLMSVLPTGKANLLMICVLLPFWTSLLVRTTSWIVLLQTEGVVNDIFVWLGIISDENRLTLIYNMFGTIVAMTHILLPFMVLPLYSVMKSIDPSYLRAARSLGANPVVAFVRVYMPQTKPGIGAGALLVFILAIGYYITPALVGGRTGQMISNFIAYHMQQSLNWGLAAALAGILLLVVMVLYAIFNKLVGIDKLRLG
jgi:putative spermidine/putrescine transport system permease protein